jgi:protocatechuate 3,4-dioxygenase beta subunit
VSGEDGGYRFRTIRPVAYPGRTPHIHFAISPPGGGRLVTQMYVAGEPLNARDPVLNEIRDPAARARVTVPLEPIAEVDRARSPARSTSCSACRAVVRDVRSANRRVGRTTFFGAPKLPEFGSVVPSITP